MLQAVKVQAMTTAMPRQILIITMTIVAASPKRPIATRNEVTPCDEI
jgi:hypothetical protein